jgi:hypothetical protein
MINTNLNDVIEKMNEIEKKNRDQGNVNRKPTGKIFIQNED